MSEEMRYEGGWTASTADDEPVISDHVQPESRSVVPNDTRTDAELVARVRNDDAIHANERDEWDAALTELARRLSEARDIAASFADERIEWEHAATRVEERCADLEAELERWRDTWALDEITGNVCVKKREWTRVMRLAAAREAVEGEE